MAPILTSSMEEQIRLLREAANINDLARLLEVPPKALLYYIYRRPSASNYVKFDLPKRSGGVRVISAPSSPIKILQSKVAILLGNIYRPRYCVQGFQAHRSIVTNAQTHARSRIVLNIDLENFFPSINFGRVRGALLAKPFELHKDVATLIAQISCFENALPQGSPCSPILSNIVCGRLDSDLLRLAKKHRCIYTRYADDITFSTTRRTLSPRLVLLKTDNNDGAATAGKDLRQVIENSNGFLINSDKVRVQTRGSRQEVTGLTINTSPNVQRGFIGHLRAIVHAIRKFGPEQAEREHHSKYYRRHRRENKLPPLRYILDGKLGFLRMVKGEADPVYRKMVNQVNAAYGEPLTYMNNPFKDLGESLWILESNEHSHQGTGFNLYGYGIITCQHVIASDLVMFKADDVNAKYPAHVMYENADLDVAIIRPPKLGLTGLVRGDASAIQRGDAVTLSGFPNYRLGDQPYVTGGQVANFRTITTLRWMLLNTPIIGGNSGGPVLNAKGEVVGIAATGTRHLEQAGETEHHGVIPISAVDFLTPPEAI